MCHFLRARARSLARFSYYYPVWEVWGARCVYDFNIVYLFFIYLFIYFWLAAATNWVGLTINKLRSFLLLQRELWCLGLWLSIVAIIHNCRLLCIFNALSQNKRTQNKIYPVAKRSDFEMAEYLSQRMCCKRKNYVLLQINIIVHWVASNLMVSVNDT